MRVQPPPGTYHVAVDGVAGVIVITTGGMISTYVHWGMVLEMAWDWMEIGGGPVAAPAAGLAIQHIGFNADGTLDMVFKDGSGKVGTYAPA